MKQCNKCKETKSKSEFHKSSTTKDGLQYKCIICRKEYDKINAKKAIERSKLYYKNNIDKVMNYKKKYQQKNADKIREKKRLYYEKNAKKIRQMTSKYTEQRRKKDPLYKFIGNIRSLIKGSFKRGLYSKFKKQTKTELILCCTISELRDHLVKQFQPGMTLENHGEWHIDHIIPLSTATSQNEIEKLCHYTNLQPLWASDNFKKSNKLY